MLMSEGYYRAMEETYSKRIDELMAENKRLRDEHGTCSLIEQERNRLINDVRRLREALGDYGQHSNECILSQWSAGEPTADGGYRTQYAGKWYQTKPIDETPKCECGFDEALRGGGE